MPTVSEVRAGLLSWAVANGIMADNIAVDTEGDVSLVPFPANAVEYFRTRKVVRVVADEATGTLVVYSRLKIAEAKIRVLVKSFADRYDEEQYRLRVDFTKPFKVDQHLESYGKHEPLRYHNLLMACGSSVGLGNQRNAGTLTALARRKGDDGMYGLSCNHVTGGCGTTRPGTPVVMPGIQDVDEEYRQIHVVGDHESVAEMRQGLPSVYDTTKNRDLAFFRLRDPAQLTSMQGSGQNAYDTPKYFENDLQPRMPVKKWGRSTGFTTGEISSINQDDEPIPYQVESFYGPMYSQTFKGTVYFHQVIEVTPDSSKPFSLGGDSGSLVVTNFRNKVERIVGIVIAGDRNKSIVLPIRAALAEYDLHLVHGHNV